MVLAVVVVPVVLVKMDLHQLVEMVVQVYKY